HYTCSDSRYTNSKIGLDFRTHKTLEILEFFFKNYTLLYRLSSYTFYKLQLYNIALFALLKIAPAKKIAFTLKNIKAGFTANGLFLFNPNRVLRTIPSANEVKVESYQQDVELQMLIMLKSSTNIIFKDNRIKLLTTIDNEAKVRRSTKSLLLGNAKGEREGDKL
ncbi:hypothetical protein LSUB1_G003046, partial [Lachnellula subtilissima]